MQNIIESKPVHFGPEVNPYRVLDPLLELLKSQHDDWRKAICWGEHELFSAASERLVLIELPSVLDYYTLGARVITTLLWKSASFVNSVDSQDPDPYRFPFRFRILKETHCHPEPWGFDGQSFLAIDYTYEFLDRAAAERQVALLVEYLREVKNLLPHTGGIF